MFTSANFKTLVFVTNLAWHTGAIPYRFVRYRNGEYHIVGTFTKARAYSTYAHFALSSFYVLFIVFRLAQKALFGDGNAPLHFLVKMGYLFFAYGLPILLQLNTIFYWEEVPRFLEQYIKFFRSLQEEYVIRSTKGIKCMKFFSSIILISIGTLIQNLIHIRRKPFLEHFLTSVLEDPKNASAIAKLPFLVGNLCIWLNIWIYIYVFCFHWYMYIACGVYMVKELDIIIKNPRTISKLRHPPTCARVLRSMQVLHRLWQVNNESFLCPTHKGSALAVATLGIYGLVKLTGPRSLIMGIIALFSLMYMFTLFSKFGKFNDMSRRTLANWTNSVGTTKHMKKFIKSVPEFRVRIGSFYYIEKFTVVWIMYAVMDNTITLFYL